MIDHYYDKLLRLSVFPIRNPFFDEMCEQKRQPLIDFLLKMADKRKLQAEIQQVAKKVEEGLVTFDEVASGEIRHAIRFTVPQTRREFVWPARHYASSLTGSQYPRMGERLRLKASVDISGFPARVQVILRAMKKYGIILADNGSAWFISGAPDSRWNDSELTSFSRLIGSTQRSVR